MTTYTLNRRTGTLHRRIDGKSYESCNLDQLVQRQDSATEPLHKRKCLRCFRSDREAIGGN
jgi:hypothetical protein